MSDGIHAAGGEVIAISVDSEERNAAMRERWPVESFLFVSDPGGEEHLRRMDVFDPEERGGIALPGLFVLAPDGREVFAHRGRDFADRTEDDVVEALERLGLDAIEAPAGAPVVADVEVDQKGTFTPELFTPYFLGNRFGAMAIAGRLDGDARDVAEEHADMAAAMLEAWKEVRS
ncbi:peroxiredoxin family protein [Ilumatobacter sp.]|uniref:peroxiredoxin family protein n=1 Tax=Ilumatobacter sp. TaxID=1967498 RepID=UPI003B51EBC3